MMRKSLKVFTSVAASCMLLTHPVVSLAANNNTEVSMTAVEIIQESSLRLEEQSKFRIDTISSIVHRTRPVLDIRRSEANIAEIHSAEQWIDNMNLSVSEIIFGREDSTIAELTINEESKMLVDYDNHEIHTIQNIIINGEEITLVDHTNETGIFYKSSITNQWEILLLPPEILGHFFDMDNLSLLISTISKYELIALEDLLRLSKVIDEDGNEFYKIAVNFNERILMEILEGHSNGLVDGVLDTYMLEDVGIPIEISRELYESLQIMRMNVSYVQYIDAETLLPSSISSSVDAVLVFDIYGENIALFSSGEHNIQFSNVGENSSMEEDMEFPSPPRIINEQGIVE